MTVGKLIRERLKVLDMTQAQLAKLMGVSKQAVSLWARDQGLIRTDRVRKLAAILGLDPSELSPLFRK
jgi:transcriptional regulator with XRE-family HTH domain